MNTDINDDDLFVKELEKITKRQMEDSLGLIYQLMEDWPLSEINGGNLIHTDVTNYFVEFMNKVYKTMNKKVVPYGKSTP